MISTPTRARIVIEIFRCEFYTGRTNSSLADLNAHAFDPQHCSSTQRAVPQGRTARGSRGRSIPHKRDLQFLAEIAVRKGMY